MSTLKLSERMYEINAQISCLWIAKQDSMPIDVLMKLNKEIGEWIKEVRDMEDKHTEKC
jgi:hypothetical protein